MKRSQGSTRMHRVLVPALLALASVLGMRASPAEERKPSGEPKKVSREEGSLVRLQADVERRYLHLKSLMSKILAAVEKAESSDRVSAALEKSEELGIVRRLREIQDFLEKKQLRDALEEEKIAERDLLRVLRILQGLDEEEQARQEEEEQRKLEDELERLEKLVKDQEEQVEETKALDEEEAKGSEADEKQGMLAKKQKEIAGKTDDLRRSLDRKSEKEEAAPSEETPDGSEAGAEDQGGSQGGDGKEGGSQGKQGGKQGGKGGKQGGKQGGKDGGKEGGQKAGQKSGSQGGKESGAEGSKGGQKGSQAGKGQKSASQKSSRNAASRARSLRQATQSMQGASQRLEAGNLKGAIEDEEEALAQLKRAMEKAQDEMEQRAEEAEAQKARRLVARLQAMLAEQELVSADTKGLDFSKKDAGESAGGGASAESLEAEGRSLARRERALQTEAEDIRKSLDENEVSVVAPPILEEVAGNLDHAAALLDGGEAGERTQVVQRDIEAALRELIEALKPPEKKPAKGEAMAKKMKMKKKERVTPVMEVKMLLSAQRRLRLRTERLERARLEAASVPAPPKAAEAATDPIVEKPAAEPEAPPDPIAVEAGRLSEAQKAVAGLAVKLMEKYPMIDPLILGEQNIEEGEKPQVVPPKPPGEDSSPGIDPRPIDVERGEEGDGEEKDRPKTVETTEEAEL